MNEPWTEVKRTSHFAKRWLHSSHSLCKLLHYNSMSEIISYIIYALVSLTLCRWGRKRMKYNDGLMWLCLKRWRSKTNDSITIMEPSALCNCGSNWGCSVQKKKNISLSNPALEYSTVGQISCDLSGDTSGDKAFTGNYFCFFLSQASEDSTTATTFIFSFSSFELFITNLLSHTWDSIRHEDVLFFLCTHSIMKPKSKNVKLWAQCKWQRAKYLTAPYLARVGWCIEVKMNWKRRTV